MNYVDETLNFDIVKKLTKDIFQEIDRNKNYKFLRAIHKIEFLKQNSCVGSEEKLWLQDIQIMLIKEKSDASNNDFDVEKKAFEALGITYKDYRTGSYVILNALHVIF